MFVSSMFPPFTLLFPIRQTASDIHVCTGTLWAGGALLPYHVAVHPISLSAPAPFLPPRPTSTRTCKWVLCAALLLSVCVYACQRNIDVRATQQVRTHAQPRSNTLQHSECYYTGTITKTQVCTQLARAHIHTHTLTD